METNLHNNYLFQALDAYPYNLEETLEALNYALSYNNKDAQALCLMGRVYAEQLKDYETAKQYFAESVAQRMEMPNTYPHYIYTLLLNEDFEEAQKLIEFALTIKSIDRAVCNYLQARLFETLKEFKKAIKYYKEAKLLATNNYFINCMDEEIERVKKKIKPKKKKANKKKKKKTKKK